MKREGCEREGKGECGKAGECTFILKMLLKGEGKGCEREGKGKCGKAEELTFIGKMLEKGEGEGCEGEEAEEGKGECLRPGERILWGLNS